MTGLACLRAAVLCASGRPDRLFLRIDDLQFLHISLFQFPPHHPGQRIDVGLVDIRYAKSYGIEFISRSHGADDRNAGLLTLQHQFDLCRDRIDGVNHIIVLPEGKVRSIFRQEETVMDVHLRFGIDLLNAFFHNLRLVSSDGFLRRNDLPVDIA